MLLKITKIIFCSEPLRLDTLFTKITWGNTRGSCKRMQTSKYIIRLTYYCKPKKNIQLDLNLSDKINDIVLEYPYNSYRSFTDSLRRE